MSGSGQERYEHSASGFVVVILAAAGLAAWVAGADWRAALTFLVAALAAGTVWLIVYLDEHS